MIILYFFFLLHGGCAKSNMTEIPPKKIFELALPIKLLQKTSHHKDLLESLGTMGKFEEHLRKNL